MGSQLRKLRAKAGVAGREHQAELRRAARTRTVEVVTGGQAGASKYEFKVEQPERGPVFAHQDLELSIGGVPFPSLPEPVTIRTKLDPASLTTPGPERYRYEPVLDQRPAPHAASRRPPIHSLLALAMVAGLALNGGRRDGY